MLKKSIITILIIVFFLCIYAENSKPIFSGYAKNFEVYQSRGSISSAIKNCTALDMLFMRKVQGEGCKVSESEFDLELFLSDFNAKIVFIEQVDGITSYYAYSPKVKYLENIGERVVNLHVAVSGEQVTLGSPIIYGSF